MATVTTRQISVAGESDKVAIRVESDDYAGMTGLIQLTVSAYQPTVDGTGTSAAGRLDIRAARHNDDNDTAIMDDVVVISTGGSVAVTDGLYCFAVNNGVPGPAISSQQDGGWELMHVTWRVRYTADIDPTSFTVTYSVGFTDLDT